MVLNKSGWSHSAAVISAVLQFQLICTYSWPLWHILHSSLLPGKLSVMCYFNELFFFCFFLWWLYFKLSHPRFLKLSLPKLWLLYCHHLLSSSHKRQQQQWPLQDFLYNSLEGTGISTKCRNYKNIQLWFCVSMGVMLLPCESPRTWSLTAVILQSSSSLLVWLDFFIGHTFYIYLHH